MTGRMNFKRHVLETNAEYCTADYGTRQPDYQSHHGMDFVNDLGGVCYAVAVADGEVVYVQNGVEGFDSVNYTAGNYVKILHENGTITRYLHLRNGSICVKIGQKVKAGDKLGIEGNTGYSYGTHLHFDVQVGNEYVDPLPYLMGEKDFGNEKPSSDKSEIKIGDRVKMKQGATFSDGTKPFDYVYEQIFEVYNISRDGKEALIGLSGDYTGWVYLADLEKVSTSTAHKKSIKVGDTVKVKSGAKTYNGGALAVFVYTQKYTVMELKGDRAVIGQHGQVTAAVNKADLTAV